MRWSVPQALLAQMLLGIISFSPAKGRGEGPGLLMTLFFPRCFPDVQPFPRVFPPGNQTLPTVGVSSRAQLWCGMCSCLALLGSGHPSLSLGYPRHSPIPALCHKGHPMAPAAPSLCCRASGGREKTLMDRGFLHDRELGAQSCPRSSSVLSTEIITAKISWKSFVLQKPTVLQLAGQCAQNYPKHRQKQKLWGLLLCMRCIGIKSY